MHDVDRSIYRGLCRHDPRALEKLIHRYSRRLLVLIRRILGGWGTLEDAEEVLADTFVIVWYHIQEYEPRRAPLATWIAMRAKYAALDRRRELRRQWNTVSLVEDRRPRQEQGEGTDRAERWDMSGLLSTLPEIEQELVYRRYYLQETLPEIAEEVGLSVHAVRNRLWRIRRRLSTLILSSEASRRPDNELRAASGPSVATGEA